MKVINHIKIIDSPLKFSFKNRYRRKAFLYVMVSIGCILGWCLIQGVFSLYFTVPLFVAMVLMEINSVRKHKSIVLSIQVLKDNIEVKYLNENGEIKSETFFRDKVEVEFRKKVIGRKFRPWIEIELKTADNKFFLNEDSYWSYSDLDLLKKELKEYK